ncbi:MAG: winged helix-turn-helix transcriptional regulator [Clostridiales bacterium]|nr:winged helix-turn-helix transcriptional regulator [Clostridiales bacterium]
MLAEQILALNLATRKLCKNCDNGTVISQKMRLLYLVRNDVMSPRDLVGELCIAKPNLTILARNMIAEGMIEKLRVDRDLRSVHYKITEKGAQELERMMAELDKSVAEQLELSDKEMQKGEKKLEAALDFINGSDE